jgi:hypothetical protein
MNPHITITNALAMRAHLAHENERMREALRTIAQLAEKSTSALVMSDIARIARAALITAPRENTTLRHPENNGANHADQT